MTTEKGLSKATSEALRFSPSQTMTEDQNVVRELICFEGKKALHPMSLNRDTNV